MSTSTATAIIALTGGQAQEAWDRLVDRHGADVFRLIRSRLTDTHAAEDAYQEFWLSLPTAAARFRPDPADPERKARAWLMHIAYTTAIAQHRKSPRQAAAAVDQAPSPHEADMDHHERQSDLIELVRAAVERMPEEQRRPLLLHIVAGLSYEDLAADLRCTVNNARVKVHRGLKRLREMLGSDGERLSEQTLAGLLLPPLLVPPALPPLPPVAAAPAVASPAAGPIATAAKTAVAVAAKAPLLVGLGVAGATAAVAGTVIVLHQPASPESAPMIRPLAATVLATAGLAAATALDDFERDDTGMMSNTKGAVAIAPAPAGIGSGRALRLSWGAEHQVFVDCNYRTLNPVPAVTADGAATATLKIWAEAFAGVKAVSIRFTDAAGETWQWSAPLPNPGQSGWRELRIPIIPDQHKGHWGPKHGEAIAFPVRLNGYALGFDNATIPAGAVVIDDVDVQAGQTSTTAP